MAEDEADARAPELVEIRQPSPTPGALWQPSVGDETLQLLGSLSDLAPDERQRLSEESVEILARCLSATAPDGRQSGLVVGNIQSGKTLSFTTVSALARDNGYRIVIIITGTVKILNSQSVKRLANHLRLNSRSDYAWRLYRDPKSSQALANEVRDTLQDWKAPTAKGLQPQTILITVLKHAGRLKSLAGLLERLDLRSVPVVVIDDEADQAGLNTAVNSGNQSATYRALCRLRAALPHHTYLGYTATPQAPLLINIMDVLSARFARVLTPGADYTGGAAFFGHQPPLVRTIPDDQIPSDNNPILGPPVSLMQAMQIFFLGVAAGVVRQGQECGPRNRSMLIHPSMLTAQHAGYFGWVQTLKDSWVRLLTSKDQVDQPDRDQLLADFRHNYDDLHSTQPDLPQFSELSQVLPQAIRRTKVNEINRRPANQFPGIDDIDEFWRSSYSFILVGGQTLERGFTVEGLTVTYMPRGIGAGQADTVQQRARFYGYNRRHIGYCRVFLEGAANDAYRAYVGSEDWLRGSLAEHSAAGRPLTEWQRMFFLDKSLRPTRNNVLDIDYTRGPDPDVPHIAMPPIFSPEDLTLNRAIVSAFETSLPFEPDQGDDRRTLAQRHEVSRGVLLSDALGRLIVPLRISDPADSMNFLQIRLQIQRYLEGRPDAQCTIFRMRPSYADNKRSLTSAGRIQPFQGANAPTGYPGDIKIVDTDLVTVQLHHLTKVEAKDAGAVLANDVPLMAVFLPSDVAAGMIVQDQGGHQG